jgi:hypothetical protein
MREAVIVGNTETKGCSSIAVNWLFGSHKFVKRMNVAMPAGGDLHPDVQGGRSLLCVAYVRIDTRQIALN